LAGGRSSGRKRNSGGVQTTFEEEDRSGILPKKNETPNERKDCQGGGREGLEKKRSLLNRVAKATRATEWDMFRKWRNERRN